MTDGPRRRRGERTPLHEVGEAPDYRFTLANERTFLAWVRTSLGLIAAGVAVAQFVPGPAAVRQSLAFVLVSYGGLLAGASYRHWERNERAMRLGERLPYSRIPRLTAAALALVALAALVLMIIDMTT
jgi:putative membrane protein